MVLVSRAGTGIGRALARGFLDAGAAVAIAGRRPHPLQAALDGYPAGFAVLADNSDDWNRSGRWWTASSTASAGSTSS